LIRLHPQNAVSLDAIEKALYIIALDDVETGSLEEAVKYGLYKNSKNRFFDKAYIHIITKDGINIISNSNIFIRSQHNTSSFETIGFGTSNTEHSAYDGICSGTVSNYIVEESKKANLSFNQVLLTK
jgi:hypothetical protein